MALVALTCASATLTGVLSGWRTRASRIIAAATVLLSVLLVQTPVAARVLHLRPLHLDDWGIALAIGAAAVTAPVLALRPRKRRHQPHARRRPD
jgi:hypothetical protein